MKTIKQLSEKYIETQCCNLCKNNKILPLKLALVNMIGFPDRTLLKDGKTVFVEFKTMKGQQSKMQIVWQKRLEDLGFKYYLVRDIETMQEVINNEFI